MQALMSWPPSRGSGVGRPARSEQHRSAATRRSSRVLLIPGNQRVDLTSSPKICELSANKSQTRSMVKRSVTWKDQAKEGKYPKKTGPLSSSDTKTAKL